MRASRIPSILILVCAGLLVALPAYAAFPQLTCSGSGSCANPQFDQWPGGNVTWGLNPDLSKNNVSLTLAQVKTALNTSFQTWSSAPNTSLTITEGADCSGCTPASNVTLVCFACSDSSLTDPQTLGVTLTNTTFNSTAGAQFAAITSAQTLFNPLDCFTDTSGGACTGRGANSQTVALQVVATHEFGHFLGLDHSAVVRAVMFVSAGDITTLSYDDVAGISFLYPGLISVATGKISGTVLLNGAGVFGAHVYAESITQAEPFSAFVNVRKSPIGTYSITGGAYTLQGLPPDQYVVIAEPLDGPVNGTGANADVGLTAAYGPGVQTNFTTRWH